MIEQLIEQIESRFAELGEQMGDPEVIADRERYAEVGRAYRQLQDAAALAAEWRRAQDDAAGAEELLAEDGDDPEVRELLTSARERIEQLEEQIRLAMVERDPNDDKNVIVEIQGGAGGEEADCHTIRLELEHELLERFEIDHTTLQVDHRHPRELLQVDTGRAASH